ncbi:MAG: class I SAM-dependent methyltransferase [Candidatus Spechtbacterales bacterium]|nr:class I SAM-dependent methyltransferase [Candidatus Spechtbacterales bacterium]
MKIRKKIEKILYSFGTSFSGYDVDIEIKYLKDNILDKYKNRDVVDIGCGDGKLSIRIKEVLEPESFLGVDLSDAMIASAQKKGLDARVLNVEETNLSGDMGVMWGSLHHLTNPVRTTKNLSGKFKDIMIRESIDDSRIFELGHKMSKQDLMNVIEDAGLIINEKISIPENKSMILFVSKGE